MLKYEKVYPSRIVIMYWIIKNSLFEVRWYLASRLNNTHTQENNNKCYARHLIHV